MFRHGQKLTDVIHETKIQRTQTNILPKRIIFTDLYSIFFSKIDTN